MESVPLETAGIVAGGPPPDPSGKAETVVPLLPVSSAPSNTADPSTPTSAVATMATSEAPPVYNTLNEPVIVTLKRDVWRVIHNLRNVVLPMGRGEGAHSSIRDWDLWGPFFFIIFLAFILSSSASENKSKVFAVVFGVLSSGAIILTLNVLLLGGRIIFFQSLSVLGYCLFPLDIGAFWKEVQGASMPTLSEDAAYLIKMFAIGSVAVVSLPFLLPAAFVLSPLVAVLAAYGFVKSRSPQQKLLQGPSSSAGRRPWQPSPGVPHNQHQPQEKQAALLLEPASTSMDVQGRSGLPPAREQAAGGERGPSSRAGGFGETQAGERTSLDAARRFPSPELAVPHAPPSQAVRSQAQPAFSGAAPSQAAAPHVTSTPPAGIRAFPSSPESVHVAGLPKARAVAGLGSMEGPAVVVGATRPGVAGAARPTVRMRVQAIDSGGAEEEPAGGRGTRAGGSEVVEQQRRERTEEEEEEEEGPSLVLHHIPKDLTGVARIRVVEAAETGETGEAGKAGGVGVEAPKASKEEMAAAGVAGQEGCKPEAEVEEKRVVFGQGGEGSEEEELLVEKEVQEEGVRVATAAAQAGSCFAEADCRRATVGSAACESAVGSN
ncbi:unnamed protein product [Closterium sp. Naga37s-1]|nr:unnamed protein product [Closterium sp. Naga37s-1]